MVESTKYFKAIDSMFRIILFFILFFPVYGMDVEALIGQLSYGKVLEPAQTGELRDIVRAISLENPYVTIADFNLEVQPACHDADFEGMLFLLNEFRTKDPRVLVGKLYTDAIRSAGERRSAVRSHIVALKNEYRHKAGYSSDDWTEIVDTASLLLTPDMNVRQVTRIIDALNALNTPPAGIEEVIQINNRHDINNLLDHMPETPNIRIMFGPGVDAELRAEFGQTIELYGKTMEVVPSQQQLQPLRQRHFVKLIKEAVATYDNVQSRVDTVVYSIQWLAGMQNALRRFSGVDTRADFYDSLDTQEVRINREKLRQAKLPQLPASRLSGVEILSQFERIIASFDLDNPTLPNFLPITIVNPEAKTTDNNRVLVQENIDQVIRYLRVLYGLESPQGNEEWKPKLEEVPSLKQGLEAIFAKLEATEDPSVKAMNAGLLMSGLLHCPAGQKEGVDTVLKTVVYSENAASSGIEEQIKTLIALRKEDVFGQIVLEPSNPENNHITSFYKHALQEELGLFSSSENYRETNHQRNDQYEGSPDVVVARFYKTVTPEFLAKLIFGVVENAEDKRLKAQVSGFQKIIQDVKSRKDVQQKIVQLERMLGRVSTATQAEQMRTQIGRLRSLAAPEEYELQSMDTLQKSMPGLKQQLALNKKARSISTGDIIQYLTNRYHVDYMDEEEKDEFFRAYLDRSVNDESAVLTLQGAHNLCVDLGYVIDETEVRLLAEAIRISFEYGVPERKLARENQRIMDEFHSFQEIITADYARFVSSNRTVSKAVSYLGYLRKELADSLKGLNDLVGDDYEIQLDEVKKLSRKILAIITQGQGVGGLATRVATPAEAGIIGDVFAMAMQKAAPNIVRNYIQSQDISKLSPNAQRHEKIIWVKTQVEELKKDSDWAGSDLSGKARLVRSKVNGVFPDIEDDIISVLVR